MMAIRFAFLLVFSLTSCQALSPTTPSVTEQRLADKTSARAQQWTRHMDGEVSLSIAVPDGWETYNTTGGIVLNEYMGSGVPGTPLRGFLVHIFVPHLDDVRLPSDSDQSNAAWFVLKQVIRNKKYVGDALVSEPVAFHWDQHDAAYYLLNNRNRTVTMLLALMLPDRSNLVVCHVSVPENQAHRIRSLLPALLETLTIDGSQVDVSALHNLPDPLMFPVEETPPGENS